jgi:hypothetical protein
LLLDVLERRQRQCLLGLVVLEARHVNRFTHTAQLHLEPARRTCAHRGKQRRAPHTARNVSGDLRGLVVGFHIAGGSTHTHARTVRGGATTQRTVAARGC